MAPDRAARWTDHTLREDDATFARGDLSFARMQPLEVASGAVYGDAPVPAIEPDVSRQLNPRDALEYAVAVALSHPPCVVSFSGGRDSSAILALAVHVARRHGFDLPIPVTLHFPDDRSREDEWQSAVIEHLGLSDWVRLELVDELDLLGDLAVDVLNHFGALWPFNSHFHLPIARQAVNGSVLSGVGGDEMLGVGPPWHRVNRVLARRTRPGIKDVARLAVAFGPARARARFVRRHFAEADWPWLTAEARDLVESTRFRAMATSPVVWGAEVKAFARSRYVRGAMESLAAVCALGGAELFVSPFFSPVFMASVARHKRFGFGTRAAALDELVGDLLPRGVSQRQTKASFDAAFWGPHARAFAAAWDGSGVDEAIVDVGALQRIWKDPKPPARTFALLQAAFLAARSDDARPS